MIISHKYKFIFVKTMKTAGTSIEAYLSPYCGQFDILTPINPPLATHVARNYQGLWNPLPELILLKGRFFKVIFGNLLRKRKFHNHIPASLIRQRVPANIWNAYFKFCVERNPWDMVLSNYYMLKYRSGGKLSFNDYIERNKFRSNYDLYTDDEESLLVDKVIRYETLMEELGIVLNQMGIPFNGRLDIKAKSEYREDRTPYQQVFSETQRKVVEKAFAREIKMHGYTY